MDNTKKFLNKKRETSLDKFPQDSDDSDIKSPKKENIIISNDKLNIISNIKKEEFGSQIGQWQTKLEKSIKNNINIKNKKPKSIEKGIQYKAIDNKITRSKNKIKKICIDLIDNINYQFKQIEKFLVAVVVRHLRTRTIRAYRSFLQIRGLQ